MLMTKERRPAIRTLRGWAISVLNDAGAIRECEEHGWMQDRADPHAASGPSLSPVSTRRPASLQMKPWRKSATFSTRSATPARSVRRRLPSAPVPPSRGPRMCFN
jgi:hypothetical protein